MTTTKKVIKMENCIAIKCPEDKFNQLELIIAESKFEQKEIECSFYGKEFRILKILNADNEFKEKLKQSNYIIFYSSWNPDLW